MSFSPARKFHETLRQRTLIQLLNFAPSSQATSERRTWPLPPTAIPPMTRRLPQPSAPTTPNSQPIAPLLYNANCASAWTRCAARWGTGARLFPHMHTSTTIKERLLPEKDVETQRCQCRLLYKHRARQFHPKADPHNGEGVCSWPLSWPWLGL